MDEAKIEALILRMDNCFPKINEALRCARAKNPWADELNINHTNIMAMLADEPSQTMSELSKSTGLAMSALTGLTDKLVKLGYTTKEKSEQDGRSYTVNLTEKGQPLAKKIRHIRLQSIWLILSKLKEKEVEAAVEGYEKLVNAFWDLSCEGEGE